MLAANRMVSSDEQVLVVSANVDDKPKNGITVSNFTVEGDHTYFVSADGEDWAWVHNDCASELRDALEARGKIAHVGDAAHHIVARNDPRASQAVRILDHWGIGLNSAENGVFLPGNKAIRSTQRTRAVAHSTVHTDRYYAAITEALKGAKSRSQATSILESIANQLKSGHIPGH